MPKTVWVIDPTCGNSNPAAGSIGVEADPTGEATAGDTVRQIDAAYNIKNASNQTLIAAGDVVSFDASVWHDAKSDGRLIFPNSDYVTTDKVKIRAHGSNADGVQAHIDQGTFLTTTINANVWTLLDSAGDEEKFIANGDVNVQTPRWVQNQTWVAKFGPIGTAIPICRAFSGASRTHATNYNGRDHGSPMRMYETRLERITSDRLGISGMGVDRGRWTSATWPCCNAKGTETAFSSWRTQATRKVGEVYYVSGTGVANRWRRITSTSGSYTSHSDPLEAQAPANYYGMGFKPVSGVTYAYLFVLTGSATKNPTHADTLGGMYVTTPLADTNGIMFQDIDTYATCQDILISGTNAMGFKNLASNKNSNNVRFIRCTLTRYALKGFQAFGSSSTARVVNDPANAAFLDCVSDPKFTAAVEAYSWNGQQTDYQAASAWEIFEIDGWTTGVRIKNPVVYDTTWHGGFSLPHQSGAGLSDTTWPGQNLVVDGATVEVAPGIRDSRGFSVGGVKQWAVINGNFTRLYQGQHLGGQSGLIENCVFRDPGGVDSINYTEGDRPFDFTYAGQTTYFDGNYVMKPNAVGSVWKNTVIRHNVFDERNNTNGRVALFAILSPACTGIQAGQLVIYNNIIIVDKNSTATLNGDVIDQTHLFKHEGTKRYDSPTVANSLTMAMCTTTAAGYKKQVFRNNVIVVNCAANEDPYLVASHALCMKFGVFPGQRLALTPQFASYLDARGVSHGGVFYMFSDATNINYVMTWDQAMLDPTTLRPLAGSPILKLGWAAPAFGDHHDSYIYDYTGTQARHVSTPTPGRWETAGSSTPVVLTPRLDSVTPNGATEGDGDTEITCVGGDFASGDKVEFDGSDLTTVDTQAANGILTATIPALSLTPGAHKVRVRNAADTKYSAEADFVVTEEQVVLAPTISSLSPDRIIEDTAFTLTVYGSNLADGQSVLFNGATKTATYVAATGGEAAKLTVSLLAADVPAAAIVDVQVSDATAGTSQLATFTIDAAPALTAPEITSLYPAVYANNGAFTLSVMGTNFAEGRVTVKWNGSNRTTTWIGDTRLEAAILEADVQNAGTASVTVYDSLAGTSNAKTYAFPAAPATTPPSITALAPAVVDQSYSGDLSLTVYGADFAAGYVVKWNGSALVTDDANAATGVLVATVPEANMATAGDATITVYDATAGTSAGATFTITGDTGGSTLPPKPFFTGTYRRTLTTNVIAPQTAPTLLLSNATASSFDYQISRVDLATSYKLYVSSDDVTFTEYLDAGLFGTISSLEASTEYSVYCVASNANGDGPLGDLETISTTS